MKSLINAHNKTVLEGKEEKQQEEEKCNCRDKENCPLEGRCNIRNIAYSGEVIVKDENDNVIPSDTRKYYGQTVHWKQRQYGHTTSFNTPQKVLTRIDKETKEPYDVSIEEQIEEKKARTELANYVWQLKQKGKNPTIRW